VDKNTPLSHSHGGKSLVSGDRKQCTKLSEDNEIRVLFHWDGKLYCSCYKYSMGMRSFHSQILYREDIIFFNFSVEIGNFPVGTKFHVKLSTGDDCWTHFSSGCGVPPGL